MNAIDLPRDEEQIRTRSCPTCALCGSTGELTYTELPDRLFGAHGRWNLKTCSNRECGLIWLDPMPLEADIAKAYVNYYTHAAESGPGRLRSLRRMYQIMKRGYYAGKYDYPAGSFVGQMFGKLLYLFPMRRSEVDGEIRFLGAVPQGRLLDVGCGSGQWLGSMRELGWQVEGLDFDESSLRVARQRGLDVRCGALEEQCFPDAIFDAVTLHHVIEHVHYPVRTLTECARILKPGGTLVVCTPNSASLGHKLFKRDWRGLEPPRHLHLFSMQSMRRILEQVAFRRILIRPIIATSMIYESVLLQRAWTGSFPPPPPRRIWPTWMLTRLFTVAEAGLTKWNPTVADCMAAIAVKD